MMYYFYRLWHIFVKRLWNHSKLEISTLFQWFKFFLSSIMLYKWIENYLIGFVLILLNNNYDNLTCWFLIDNNEKYYISNNMQYVENGTHTWIYQVANQIHWEKLYSVRAYIRFMAQKGHYPSVRKYIFVKIINKNKW